MDGTLLDSEPYWFQAERELVAEFGNGVWPDDLAHQMVGFDLLDAAAFIQRYGEVPLAGQDIVERLLVKVVAQLERSVPWKPGALDLLDELNAAEVPCVLVTMSWRSFADAVLHHLEGRFVATITGDEVPEGKGKPDPLPYLMGARAAGVDPAECVAIEDSNTGCASAIAAGCQVVCVPSGFSVPPAHPSLVVVDSLEAMSLQTLSNYVRLG